MIFDVYWILRLIINILGNDNLKISTGVIINIGGYKVGGNAKIDK